jgi:hypothetical protein
LEKRLISRRTLTLMLMGMLLSVATFISVLPTVAIANVRVDPLLTVMTPQRLLRVSGLTSQSGLTA